MIAAGHALTVVPTESLKRLLRLAYKDELTCPLSITELTRVGLQGRATEILQVLRGLDTHAVRVVLIAVLAERKAVAERRPIGVLPY